MGEEVYILPQSISSSILAHQEGQPSGPPALVFKRCLTLAGYISLVLIPLSASTLFWQQRPSGIYLACVLILALLASFIWVQRIVAPVQARWCIPQPPRAHEPCVVACMVSAQHSRGPIRLVWQDDADQTACALPGLGAAPLRCSWKTRFSQRGIHYLPALEAQSYRPLGMIMARRRVCEAQDILVLPALAPVRPEAMRSIFNWLENGLHAMTPGEDEVAQLRPYRQGDSMRIIHWRASARARNLLVMERHAPHARQLSIVVDNRGPDRRSSRFERLICAVHSIIAYFIQQSWQVQLRGPWIHGGGLSGPLESFSECLALVACSPEAEVHSCIPRYEPCLIFTLDSQLQVPETQGGARCISLQEAESLVRMGRHIK